VQPTKARLMLLLLVISPLATPGDAAGAVLLDQYGSWRMFHVLKAPEIALDSGVQPVVYRKCYWVNHPTPPPPADWTRPEFDDADWLRGPAGMQCRTPYAARVCLRGKFQVADPQRAKLKLSAVYHGGAAVYVNGQQLGRKHLKAGDDLAEPYPPEAFVTPEGDVIIPEGKRRLIGNKLITAGKPSPETLKRVELRARSLEIELPPRLLRKGGNVLAIELVRAAYDKSLDEQKRFAWDKEPLFDMWWNTCELLEARLTTDNDEAVEPDGARPSGLKVSSGSLLRTDFTLDFATLDDTLKPLTLVAPRNAAASDKVVLRSAKPIRGLTAAAGELRGPGGSLPPSAIQVRYAAPAGFEYGVYEHTFGQVAAGARVPPLAEAMRVLLEAPPPEYPVPQPGTGAVAPVWLTVNVPADARPGVYEGRLAVRCDGQTPLEVPVRLEVADWKLPNPDQRQAWVEVLQSPDTLQLEYGVPAWSEKHFELIGRSLRMMRELGNAILYVPLVCCTNLGNEESMVRWIKKNEQYEFDFTRMDRYLDVAEQNQGKPKVVCFIVWDIFMLPVGDRSGHGARVQGIDKVKDRMTTPNVTSLDPATGDVNRLALTGYSPADAAGTPWRQLFVQLRTRMAARGLEQAMMLGWFSDVQARKDEIAFWRQVSGNLPWVSHGHFKTTQFGTSEKLGFTTGYMTSMHDVGVPDDPAKGRKYGWKNSVFHAEQVIRPGWRGEMDWLPGTMWNSMVEMTLAGGQRGYGRLGGDTWRVIKDKRGRRQYRAYERYPFAIWGNLELCSSLLAPGPEGAVATAHYEQFREGVQCCEARIYIEQALTDDAKRNKLGSELAERAQAELDNRILCIVRGISHYHASEKPERWQYATGEAGHLWFQSSGWKQRNARLFALAAEVQKKVGVEPGQRGP